MKITVAIDDAEITAQLAALAGRTRDLTPAMKRIGQAVRTSVIRNFEAGGRPAKWAPSQRVKKKGGKTLVKSHRLVNSITARAYPNRAEVGTNVVYAAIQQLGGTVRHGARTQTLAFKKKGGFLGRKAAGKRRTAVRVAFARIGARDTTIPARPFLLVQDEDWAQIRDEIARYLVRR